VIQDFFRCKYPRFGLKKYAKDDVTNMTYIYSTCNESLFLVSTSKANGIPMEMYGKPFVSILFLNANEAD